MSSGSKTHEFKYKGSGGWPAWGAKRDEGDSKYTVIIGGSNDESFHGNIVECVVDGR